MIGIVMLLMSENPEERNRESRKANENNIEQQAEPPLNKQDPTEPVEVKGKAGNARASADTDAGAAKVQ